MVADETIASPLWFRGAGKHPCICQWFHPQRILQPFEERTTQWRCRDPAQDLIDLLGGGHFEPCHHALSSSTSLISASKSSSACRFSKKRALRTSITSSTTRMF